MVGRDCGDVGVTFPAGLRVSDPNPKPLDVSLHRESQAAHRADGHPTVGQGTSRGSGSLVPLYAPGITYLWLQRPHPPHPKASAGRCPGQCCPFPGSPQRWPLGAGTHRPQAWWRLSPGTKRTPGREEAGQRLSAVASPGRSSTSTSTGGGHGGVRGAQTQDAFVFLPAGARGQRGSRTPARAAGLQLDPADGSQHSQTRKAAGGVRT